MPLYVFDLESEYLPDSAATLVEHGDQGSVTWAGSGSNQTPDFVYRRAVNFAPADGMVHLLFGIYLEDSGRREEAIEMFDKAADLSPQNADINYNLGLMYLKVDQPEQAEMHASRAYERGYPLPGLRKKLVAAGIWTE